MNATKLKIITIDDFEYGTCIDLIRHSYKTAFKSNWSSRPSKMLVLTTLDGPSYRIVACVTLTEGWKGALFSERYLHQPVENALSDAIRRRISRNQILEIGGFASCMAGAGIRLVRQTPAFVLGLGYRFGLVTATRQVRFLMRRAGLEFIPLTAAHPQALPPEEREAWGHYYQHHPVTGVVDFLASLGSPAAIKIAGTPSPVLEKPLLDVEAH